MLSKLFIVIILIESFVNADQHTPSLTHYSQLGEANMRQLFHIFIESHEKSYSKEEYNMKYVIFRGNLAIIDERNRAEREAGGNAVHGITRFADLTPNEFFFRYLNGMFNVTDASRPQNLPVSIHKNSFTATNTYINWSGKYTTPIKYQGSCGNCWAMGTSEQLESDAIRLLGWNFSVPLSVQQLVDCSTSDYGCTGGWIDTSYSYIKTYGLQLNVDYPFVKVQTSCQYTSSKTYLTLTGYSVISGSTTSATELAMANYVLTTGPLLMYLDANNWATYVSGILTSCGTAPNHMPQAVGIDTVNGYWILRNSWGKGWGEKGYIRVTYMANVCKLTTYPTYVTPKLIRPLPTASPQIYHSPAPSRPPSASPTSYLPTGAPTTSAPTTTTPTTYTPTYLPSSYPSAISSFSPTTSPSSLPTKLPSRIPTTTTPTKSPTATPTKPPTLPTRLPTSLSTSRAPTAKPTATLSKSPTPAPTPPRTTIAPSKAPSRSPTTATSASASKAPSKVPTRTPSASLAAISPTKTPSKVPTRIPSSASLAAISPTKTPSKVPTRTPSASLTTSPTSTTTSPIKQPTLSPIKLTPTATTSAAPSRPPTRRPS